MPSSPLITVENLAKTYTTKGRALVRALAGISLKEAIHVFNSRFALQRVDHREDQRYGVATTAQWDRLKQIDKDQGIIQGQVNANDLYAGALVDEINRFDKQAVIRQAKEWRP